MLTLMCKSNKNYQDCLEDLFKIVVKRQTRHCIGDMSVQNHWISASVLAQEIHRQYIPLIGVVSPHSLISTNSEQEVPPIPDNQITARALFDPTSQDKRTMNKASPVDDEPMHVDAAEKIYDTVKGVWGWGKTVVVVSPFLGMAEILAGKVVESAGTSLEDVDNAVTGKLQGLDDGILNPVIHVVVKTMMDAAIQTGDFIGPIVLTILKPLDFMLKSEPENGPSPHAVTRPAA